MGQFNRRKYYNPNIQIEAMKSNYPQFKAEKKGNEIEFVGTLDVKPEFPTYTVSITYRGANNPRVKILSPKLVEKPPHFYHSTKSLCLYLEKNFKWRKEKLIAKEIVAWTSGWIYFYEVWLETGEWYGPEAEHDDNLTKQDD